MAKAHRISHWPPWPHLPWISPRTGAYGDPLAWYHTRSLWCICWHYLRNYWGPSGHQGPIIVWKTSRKGLAHPLSQLKEGFFKFQSNIQNFSNMIFEGPIHSLECRKPPYSEKPERKPWSSCKQPRFPLWFWSHFCSSIPEAKSVQFVGRTHVPTSDRVSVLAHSRPCLI